jgi:hypothetical protein
MAIKDEKPEQAQPAPEKTVKQSEPRKAEQVDGPEQSSPEQSSPDVAVKSPQDPFPAYDELGLDQLRSLASEKGVGVPADVEKAALVAKLRQVGPSATAAEVAQSEGPHDVSKLGEASGEVQVSGTQAAYPSYDLMTVEELRGLLPEDAQALTEEEEKGYLIGQLRAAASGPTAAQSAQLGSARPGESLPAPSGVQDKDRGRS